MGVRLILHGIKRNGKAFVVAHNPKTGAGCSKKNDLFFRTSNFASTAFCKVQINASANILMDMGLARTDERYGSPMVVPSNQCRKRFGPFRSQILPYPPPSFNSCPVPRTNISQFDLYVLFSRCASQITCLF